MRRVLAALFTFAIVWYTLNALAERMGLLAAIAVLALSACALVFIIDVLVAVVDSPEEPR